MKAAYVDSSCVVAAAFAEPPGAAVVARMAEYDELLSSNLLAAELMASARREGVDLPAEWLAPFSWILPLRPLHAELQAVLGEGYLRGADLWHVACALYVARDPGELDFLTLDSRQARVAAGVGLRVPTPGEP